MITSILFIDITTMTVMMLKERCVEEEVLLGKSFKLITKTLQQISTRLKENSNLKKGVKFWPEDEAKSFNDESL